MKYFPHIIFVSIALSANTLCTLSSFVLADSSLEESFDCSDIQVDYTDDPSLTRIERLQLMDQAFLRSLNKFELCQAAKKHVQGGSSGTGKNSGDNAGDGIDDGNVGGNGDSAAEGATERTGEPGNAGSTQSIASSTISGTEAIKTVPASGGSGTKETGSSKTSQVLEETDTMDGGQSALSNGKIPDDIPPAQNDDALAAQIRYAAENETDPDKSRKLWNEYRKYKGLPPQ